MTINTGEGPAAHCVRCAPAGASVFRAAAEIIDAAQRAVATWSLPMSGPNLALLGPDPFVHPEFDVLLDGLSHIEAERLCITTAGLGNDDPTISQRLVDARITHFHLALLADTAATHDALIGHPGSFDTAMQRMKTFHEACTAQSAPTMLCGEIPICRHNLETIPGTVAFLASHGVRAITLDTSNAPQTSSTRAWIDAALDTGIVSGTWVCESTGSESGAHKGLLDRSPISLVEEATV